MKFFIILSALIAIALCAPAPQHGHGRRGLRRYGGFGDQGFGDYYNPYNQYQNPYYGGDYI
jgi:hypothetical protein